MTPLTESEKKLLIEFLGECWHKFQSDGMGSGYICQQYKVHRTWTDKQDKTIKITNPAASYLKGGERWMS
jgi:hypothetical protein